MKKLRIILPMKATSCHSGLELFNYLKDFSLSTKQPTLDSASPEGHSPPLTQITRKTIPPTHPVRHDPDIHAKALRVPVFTNEFWTPRQRQASSLHEISYRACFKPQLPRFFINLLSKPGDIVYDPFSGRGTTIIEAGLLARQVVANDVNPLSTILTKPRLFIPDIHHLDRRLKALPIDPSARAEIDLSMFYHPDTEAEIVSLKQYLYQRRQNNREDYLDGWIRMIATNRLSGHSPGFFSVYTLPPNQAVSPGRQQKINRRRNQAPQYRDTRQLILKKSQQLISRLTRSQCQALNCIGKKARFLEKDAANTAEIPENSVQLTVTSPPFLNVVQYAADNWLRCWFNCLDSGEIARHLTMSRTIPEWSREMRKIFIELFRITRKGGWVAFEVGEVRNGTVRLEEQVLPLGVQAGLHCQGILINRQFFTKTANIWGVKNNHQGTNTNRVVIFQKN